ncbi:TPA: hypothetical protein ACF3XN_003292 [Vibrio parahaemolyticus]|nr:hypothetical protein [Vibrio parahaemolyticus]
MFSEQEVIELKVDDAKLMFNKSLILSVHRSMSSDVWEVRAARPGYTGEASELSVNTAMNCCFGDLYEIRLLAGSPYEASLLVTKLPIMESAESIFNSSSIFGSTQNDEVFTQEEIDVLKRQLDELNARITSLISQVTELTDVQNKYLEASFSMLNEKLETGSKESWRQCAYGVFASLGCTFMPDAQTTQNLFEIAGAHISSIPSLLLGGS